MVQQVWASLLVPITEVLRQGLVIGVAASTQTVRPGGPSRWLPVMGPEACSYRPYTSACARVPVRCSEVQQVRSAREALGSRLLVCFPLRYAEPVCCAPLALDPSQTTYRLETSSRNRHGWRCSGWRAGRSPSVSLGRWEPHPSNARDFSEGSGQGLYVLIHTLANEDVPCYQGARGVVLTGTIVPQQIFQVWALQAGSQRYSRLKRNSARTSA